MNVGPKGLATRQLQVFSFRRSVSRLSVCLSGVAGWTPIWLLPRRWADERDVATERSANIEAQLEQVALEERHIAMQTLPTAELKAKEASRALQEEQVARCARCNTMLQKHLPR
jgi:hypothetical protein